MSRLSPTRRDTLVLLGMKLPDDLKALYLENNGELDSARAPV